MPALEPLSSLHRFPNVALLMSALGVIGLLAIAFLSVCIVRRRRRSYSNVPPLTRTAVALKSGNVKGPGGLKNSPSSLSSPLSSDSSMSSPVVPVRTPVQSPQTISRIAPSELGQDRGAVRFSLSYDATSSALQVNILSCRDLPELAIAADGQCLLDPYVKLQLLPEKQHRVKTRLVRATRNPQYDETFSMYGISREQLSTTSLHFAVIAFDRYSRDTVLAEAVYCLKSANLEEECTKEVELPLGGRGVDLGPDRGQILVSLCYQPTTNRVTVVVLKAKNLPKFDITGMADPYVKLYMLYSGERICKKKSHVKKRTLSPVYNESFVFELPGSEPKDLQFIQFEIVVMDWDRVTKNEVMGRCVIGADSEHWTQVRNNPRRQIAEWHPLSQ